MLLAYTNESYTYGVEVDDELIHHTDQFRIGIGSYYPQVDLPFPSDPEGKQVSFIVDTYETKKYKVTVEEVE